VDVVDVERFTRLLALRGPALTERVFTPAELVACRDDAGRLAARLAAKEAVAKALGTGIGPVAWRDIEVLHGPGGRPELRLAGEADAFARDLGLTRWSLSLTHDARTAVALVAGVGR
jgi:holo-[acyl-carrier protein] synthase